MASSRLFFLAAATLTWIFCGIEPDWGQDFPNRSVRIIVPFAAGGGSGVLARVVGQKLSAQWKQTVVVEN